MATKAGRFPDPGGAANLTREVLRRHAEASLRRLGVEALDLLQLHCVDAEALRRGEIFGWLRELQKEGKIRHFGACVHDGEEAALCLAQEAWPPSR